MKYACYSQKAVDIGFGTCFWAKPDGSLVEILEVSDDPSCSANKWEDKKLLGEVSHYVKLGKPHKHKLRDTHQ